MFKLLIMSCKFSIVVASVNTSSVMSTCMYILIKNSMNDNCNDLVNKLNSCTTSKWLNFTLPFYFVDSCVITSF